MALTLKRSKRSEGYLQPRALVASARKVDLKLARKSPLKQKEWQSDLWAYFDEVPEFKFLLLWRGNQMSKVRFYPATIDPDDPDGSPIPLTSDAAQVPPDVAAAAVRIMRRFRSQIGGQVEIQRRLEICMEAAGECHVIGLWPRLETTADGKPGGIDTSASRDDPRWDWFVCSTSELTYKAGRSNAGGLWRVKRTPNARDDEQLTLDPNYDVMFRVWQAHGQWAEEPDCAARALSSELEWLYLLTAQGKQEARSRFSAGILLLPNGLSVGAQPPGDIPDAAESEEGTETRTDPVMDQISDVLTAVVEDPEDNASVVPLALRGSADDLAQVRLLSLSRQADATLDSKIEERVKRLARGMNAPPEVVEGHMQTTFCADMATEALTTRGWQRGDEIRSDDLLFTLNHRTGLAEWQIVEAVQMFDVIDEPMLHINGRRHDSFTTANHRWPVLDRIAGDRRSWQLSETLKGSHRLLTAASCAELPIDAKYSDDFVELVAWTWTEGHFYRQPNGRYGVTTITQSAEVNADKCARLRGVLHRLFGPPRAHLRGRTADARAVGWLERRDRDRDMRRFVLNQAVTDTLNEVAPDKCPSSDFIRSLTRAQLELFIDVSLMADGYRTNMGSRVITQSRSERLGGIELACILTGRTPFRSVSRHGTEDHPFVSYHLVLAESATVAVPQHTMRSAAHAHREWVNYSGTVWCPTTRNGTWLARRNGTVYFTANSNAKQIAKDTWEDYLQPRALFNGDALTVGYFRPELMIEVPNIDEDLLNRLFVWYDESDLVEHPNLASVAVEAFDRFGISWDAFRDALGFSADDAPAPLEILLRLAIGPKTVLTPNVVTAILDGMEGGIQLPEPTAPAIDSAPGESSADSAAQARSTLQLPDIARLILVSMLQDEKQREELIELSKHHAIDTTPGEPRVDDAHTLKRSSSAAQKRRDRGLRVGSQLTAIDRELRTRLLIASNASMERALEKAGNRLRSKAKAIKASALRDVAPIDVARTLGRQLVADAGGEADALAGAFDDLETEFKSWAQTAGQQALDIVNELVGGFSTSERDRYGLRQADSIDQAWTWMQDTLTSLANAKLYDPSAVVPSVGEFDPSLRVPPGLVRQAIARAGGFAGVATGEVTSQTDRSKTGQSAWVTLPDDSGTPPGGLATGDDMQQVFTDEGVLIDGYQWEYGPALRMRPFEPHEELDGVGFVNFDDDQLANGEDFPSYPYFMPGDHDGCQCDVLPILLPPE